MENLTIATTASCVIAIAGLALAIYTALWSLPKLHRNMTLLEKRMTSTEITAEAGLILNRISTLKWPVYKEQVQQEALHYHASEQYCLELQASGKYVLTSLGKNLLCPELRERIVGILKLEPDISEKDIIITLGVQDIAKVAFSKGVPPNVMVGIIVTFVEETRKKKRPSRKAS